MDSGAGVYYQEFAHYIPIGAEGTAFEEKVKAIEIAPLILHSKDAKLKLSSNLN